MSWLSYSLTPRAFGVLAHGTTVGFEKVALAVLFDLYSFAHLDLCVQAFYESRRRRWPYESQWKHVFSVLVGCINYGHYLIS